MPLNPHEDEEKKSYSAVYLVMVGLLLAGSIWAVWDDNIFRRPWKKFQSQFFDIEYASVKGDIAKEEERLAKDPKFQEVSKKLADAEASVASGENAQKIAALERDLKKAEVTEHEWDLCIARDYNPTGTSPRGCVCMAEGAQYFWACGATNRWYRSE